MEIAGEVLRLLAVLRGEIGSIDNLVTRKWIVQLKIDSIYILVARKWIV